MSTFRIGEGASGQFDLRTIPESNLRNIIFEDFFRGKFAKDAATIVKKRSNRGLFRDKPDVMQLSVMDNFYKPALEKSFYLSPFIIKSREMISPSIGAELVTQAALAILLSLVGILIYLYVRFELNYSFGAVAAIIHDVVITVGIITILGVEFNVPVVAAVLTVIGYSLNDTIVNFDRVRENRVLMGHNAKWFNIVNRSVIEVLNRTVVTSLTTFISAMVLYLFGGVSLNGFAITLLVGIVAGTYSSIFVSNVVFFELQRRFG
jgi:preprotein translocase subunit SecF